MKFSLSEKNKNDIILISVLLIVSLLILLIMFVNRSPGGYAVVIINGRETASYPLDSNVEVKLENEDGYNLLVIEDGKAFIKEATCPDKLCVNQHDVQYNGQTLVCLPNKITVKIVSETESDVDFIS